jgi:hypothetical protein
VGQLSLVRAVAAHDEDLADAGSKAIRLPLGE